MELTYQNLTKEQKAFICNGCGGKGGKIKVPNFLFLASCNHHDFKYWVGCTLLDKVKADFAFYRWMLIDINKAEVTIVQKAYYQVWAFAYFIAVSAGGSKYFYFASKKRDMQSLGE